MPAPELFPAESTVGRRDSDRPTARAAAVAERAVRAAGRLRRVLAWSCYWAPLLLFLTAGPVLLMAGQPPDVALCAAVGAAILGVMVRDTFGSVVCRPFAVQEQIEDAGAWTAEYRALVGRYRDYLRAHRRDPDRPPQADRWLFLRFAAAESLRVVRNVLRAKAGTVLRGAAAGSLLFGLLCAAGGWTAWGPAGAAFGLALGAPLGAGLGASWRLTVG